MTDSDSPESQSRGWGWGWGRARGHLQQGVADPLACVLMDVAVGTSLVKKTEGLLKSSFDHMTALRFQRGGVGEGRGRGGRLQHGVADPQAGVLVDIAMGASLVKKSEGLQESSLDHRTALRFQRGGRGREEGGRGDVCSRV